MRKNYISLLFFLFSAFFGFAQQTILCPEIITQIKIDDTNNIPTVNENGDGTITLIHTEPYITDIFASYVIYDFYQYSPNSNPNGELFKYYSIAFQSKDLINNMKQRKCKICNIDFIPHRYASCKTKCVECIFTEQKKKLCVYQKKQALRVKPRKAIKIKIDIKQVKINKLVRERDAGKPCISCGKITQLEAGHFISRAKSTKLRYEPRNIHGQCWHCNRILHGCYEAFKNGCNYYFCRLSSSLSFQFFFTSNYA